jgi:hypothetical protein
VEQRTHRVAIVSARKDNQEVVVLVAAHMQNTTRTTECTPGRRSCRRAGSTAARQPRCDHDTLRCVRRSIEGSCAKHSSPRAAHNQHNLTTSRRIKSDKHIVGFVRAAGHQRADTLKDRTG